MAKKKCTKCGDPKPLNQFHQDASHKDGHSSQCDQCRCENGGSYYEKNKARCQARMREHYRKKMSVRENYEEFRDGRLRKQYGITLKTYWRMHKQQKGLCKICRQPETCIRLGKRRILMVDHDHKTGKVRGLICQNCNHLLGHAKDSMTVLAAAIMYLKASKETA